MRETLINSWWRKGFGSRGRLAVFERCLAVLVGNVRLHLNRQRRPSFQDHKYVRTAKKMKEPKHKLSLSYRLRAGADVAGWLLQRHYSRHAGNCRTSWSDGCLFQLPRWPARLSSCLKDDPLPSKAASYLPLGWGRLRRWEQSCGL